MEGEWGRNIFLKLKETGMLVYYGFTIYRMGAVVSNMPTSLRKTSLTSNNAKRKEPNDEIQKH